MNLDWARLRAVVLESDDWGLCAWVPDDEAWKALERTPAFRSPAGLRYGRSTLEGAADVKALAEVLEAHRGADGFAPVWQANTVMANPDYRRLAASGFDGGLPLVELPDTPARWSRPGLWDEVARACEAGLWWIELHGLHHLPESAWLAALARGDGDARRALVEESPVCRAVEASGEYDPTEPKETRRRSLERAIARFRALVGRAPRSFCPPDYRWDESLEAEAERHGVTTLQGKAEQTGTPVPRITRALLKRRFPHVRGKRFYLPPRIAFEPCAPGRVGGRAAVETALGAVRAAWKRSQPAVLSSHRLNYAHLDPAWSRAGRDALRDLLASLARDGATFLTDAEVRALVERSWSAREIGARGILVRRHGAAAEPVTLSAPAGVTGARVRESRARMDARLEGGALTVRGGEGACLIEWIGP
ncbi:MAG TPA: polysaccharide deacetylase family protein [Candidatus Eisenbacteria bacterium]